MVDITYKNIKLNCKHNFLSLYCKKLRRIEMKLTVTGDINAFYVQTLCMIFFPGEKFVENQEINENTPIMEVSVTNSETGSYAKAKLSYQGKVAESEKTVDFAPEVTKLRTAKIAAGNVVLAVGSEILGYRPSWGMLTGVRPSKVAMEMLLNGNSKAKVRKILNTDYFVIPKKASLATDVARREQKIIGNPNIKDCSIYISIPFCLNISTLETTSEQNSTISSNNANSSPSRTCAVRSSNPLFIPFETG